MKKKVSCTLIIVAFLCAGCASIVSKSIYPVSMQSSPDQAAFVIKNKKGDTVHSGTTPQTVSLKSGAGYFKKGEYTITFSKEGFQENSVKIQADLDGWYIGNIIFAGLIGFLIVDPATGAMWKLPEKISGTLVENQTTSTKNSDANALRVVLIDEIPQEYQKDLIRVW